MISAWRMSSELAFWSDDFLSARPSSPSFLLAYLVLLEHNGAKLYLNSHSHLHLHIHYDFTRHYQTFDAHPLGRQTSNFCSQTNFVTNRIIEEVKGLRVAFHNLFRSSFCEMKMGCNFREALATLFRAWKLVFSTRIVDPSHAINLTHVNRNRNTPMQLAVDHPSIPYWSLVRARSGNSMRESLARVHEFALNVVK